MWVKVLDENMFPCTKILYGMPFLRCAVIITFYKDKMS